MALPQYTGRVADWIENKEDPDAFSNAITVMALLTVARLVHSCKVPFAFQIKCD